MPCLKRPHLWWILRGDVVSRSFETVCCEENLTVVTMENDENCHGTPGRIRTDTVYGIANCMVYVFSRDRETRTLTGFTPTGFKAAPATNYSMPPRFIATAQTRFSHIGIVSSHSSRFTHKSSQSVVYFNHFFFSGYTSFGLIPVTVTAKVFYNPVVLMPRYFIAGCPEAAACITITPLIFHGIHSIWYT